MTRVSALDPMDLAGIDDLLTDEEKAIRGTVRAFLDQRVEPYVADWFERGEIDDVRGLTKELGALGLLGMHLEGYGCAGHERGRLRPGLPRARGHRLRHPQPGHRCRGRWRCSRSTAGAPRSSKQRWLPAMATGEAIGCFGLTEPDHGSDPASMRTRARRDGDDWVLDGSKMWITNGSIADVAVVWARRGEEHGGIRGFVVPTDTPGFSAPEIKHKLSPAGLGDQRARARRRAAARPTRCSPRSAVSRGRCPASPRPATASCGGRSGAARSSLDTARRYSIEREQFGRPLAGFQLTQQKLADMALELVKGQLLALHLGRRKDAGTLRPEQVSLGKLNNIREAIDICRTSRTILGANGISLEYPDHPAHEQPRVGAHLRGHRGDAHPRRRAGDDGRAGLPLSRPDGRSVARPSAGIPSIFGGGIRPCSLTVALPRGSGPRGPCPPP